MASNLFFHLTGGASNADPGLSLGGTGSDQRISQTALNNLFDNVTPAEVSGGSHVEYRALDLLNEGDATALNVEFFFIDTPNAESSLAVWLDTTGTQSIDPDTDEPVGAAGNWTTPLIGSKLSLSNLGAITYAHRLWIRRTIVQDAENLHLDTGTINAWFS
jgi:hypothetical protein